MLAARRDVSKTDRRNVSTQKSIQPLFTTISYFCNISEISKKLRMRTFFVTLFSIIKYLHLSSLTAQFIQKCFGSLISKLFGLSFIRFNL